MNKAKNKFSIFLAILVSLCLILPRQVVWSAKVSDETMSKIDVDLLEQMENKDEDSMYTVWIWLNEPNYDEIYQQINEIMGSKDDFTGTEHEWNAQYEFLLNDSLLNLYYQHTHTMMKELNLDELNTIPGYRLESVIGARISKEKILELSTNTKVTNICCYDVSDISNPEKYYEYTYTAEHALKILQVCVGLRMGHINQEYDVNGDGDISIEDALWALQAAVKLYTISWPIGTTFPE